MSGGKITLNKRQIAFVVQMMEIKDPKEAVEAFAIIMIEEKLHPTLMPKVIDRILQKQAAK